MDAGWPGRPHRPVARRQPSLFLKQRIDGDYLWQITAERVAPDDQALRLFRNSKHWANADPLTKYNFNFWLRVDSPDSGDFFQQYSQKLGTGWNGMGDDPGARSSTPSSGIPTAATGWRLRRSPATRKSKTPERGSPPPLRRAAHLHLRPVPQPHPPLFRSDAHLRPRRTRHVLSRLHRPCVWLSIVRFSGMKLYRVERDGSAVLAFDPSR